MGFVETFADSLKEMPRAPMGEALRPLWSEALADIKAEHEAGADGQAVARRIAEAMDAVVLSIYQQRRAPDGRPPRASGAGRIRPLRNGAAFRC